jgi:RNase_H superfamily
MANKKKEKVGPKILIFDIETSPLISYTWGIWDQNVGLNQIKEDWYVLAWSAKWLDDPPSQIMYQDQRNQKDISNDKKLMESIWVLLDAADIVITQNGKAFDVKKLNTRFVLHGMEPPSSYRHIDTKQLASKHFAFTSNKLEYMTSKLCTKYKKLSHKKFPGFSLWTECLKGNEDAWNEMEKYNKYDVLSLEELYHKLAPWDNSINFGVYTDEVEQKCSCGSEKELQKKGYAYTAAGKYQRFKCLDCGKQYQNKQNLLSLEKRKELKK